MAFKPGVSSEERLDYAAGHIDELIKREDEMHQLRAKEFTYKQIAKLPLSPETIKNIYKKLNVDNKVEAINKMNSSQKIPHLEN